MDKPQANMLELTLEDTVEGLIQDGSTHVHRDIMRLVEPTIYRAAMYMNKYNQSKAAKSLGVSRGTLRTKLKQYFGKEFV